MSNGVTFNLNENSGDWFDFFESELDFETGEITYFDPKPNTGRVCIRSASDLLVKQLSKRQKSSEIVLNPKTRQMERIEYYKEQTPEEMRKDSDDRIDYMITGLESFFDIDGVKIECTRENKIKLSKVPVFDRFLSQCMKLQMNVIKEQTEKEEKNSGKP